jgi:hypothetical protein
MIGHLYSRYDKIVLLISREYTKYHKPYSYRPLLYFVYSADLNLLRGWSNIKDEVAPPPFVDIFGLGMQNLILYSQDFSNNDAWHASHSIWPSVGQVHMQTLVGRFLYKFYINSKAYYKFETENREFYWFPKDSALNRIV